MTVQPNHYYTAHLRNGVAKGAWSPVALSWRPVSALPGRPPKLSSDQPAAHACNMARASWKEPGRMLPTYIYWARIWRYAWRSFTTVVMRYWLTAALLVVVRPFTPATSMANPYRVWVLPHKYYANKG